MLAYKSWLVSAGRLKQKSCTFRYRLKLYNYCGQNSNIWKAQFYNYVINLLSKMMIVWFLPVACYPLPYFFWCSSFSILRYLCLICCFSKSVILKLIGWFISCDYWSFSFCKQPMIKSWNQQKALVSLKYQRVNS